MSDESRLEVKVGALVVAAIACGLGLLYLMGEISFGSGKAVEVNFSHTGNVVKGAPVKLGGVPVGRVEKIELIADRRDEQGEPMPVHMTLNLTPDALTALRTDAAITVSSQGPLGEPYLEVWPGSERSAYDATHPLRGVDAPRIDIVSNRLAKFLESASKVLESDPEALTKLVKGVGGLTNTVDGVLSENRAEIRQIAQELAVAAKDVRSVSAMARAQLEPGGRASALIDDAAATAKLARTDLPEISKKATAAVSSLAAITAPLNEDDGQRIKALLAKYQSAGDKLDVIAARADKLLAKLEAGDGTLGALMKDKVVYDDLKSLLADLRQHPWKMLWKD